MKAPFPYFGGKSVIAKQVWERLGAVDNYVEPFFGSGAVLLSRPHEAKTETVNDADGLLSNFWRALQAEPEVVAAWADWPVNENDLHARHSWLVGQKDSLQATLEGDPNYYDAKIAGWWVWGMACWIGSGFCSGKGPWQVQEVGGVRQLVHVGDQGQGVNRKLVHVGSNGQGVNRKLVHVGDQGRGVWRQLARLIGPGHGQGINRKLGIEHKRPVISGPAGGKQQPCDRPELLEYFHELASRLKRVRVCCGDWSRVCGHSVTFKHGTTGVFLDPPYADTAKRAKDLYRVDCERVAHDVREWAIAEGQNPLMRIALCGYEGEHNLPADWQTLAWDAGEGFGGQAKERTNNGKKERIWFSPYCLKSKEQEFEFA